MKSVYIFPGSFCPPTYGHAEVANDIADSLGEVFPICSVNPEKQPWFTPKECVEMFQTYNLHKNVRVITFGNFGEKNGEEKQFVMVRGIRDGKDLDYEKEVVLFNYNTYGITNYHYLICKDAFKNISSTNARKFAENLDLLKLGTQVSPLVVTKMLEKVLDVKNIYMVVGKPGSGKSTFLKMICAENPQNTFIDTDKFTEQLKPLLTQAFGGMDLVDIAINKKEELKKVIGEQWLEKVKDALRFVPKKSNVFLEIPYGFQADKMAFRYFGGKVLYIGCANDQQNKERIIGRGTPEIVRFMDQIPGEKETLEIAKKFKLSVTCVDTSGTIDDLKKEVKRINELIK